jgi:RimJ/RimL family protein N-acetyltransferase
MAELLQTDRLRLRAFEDSDLDALGRIYADPLVTRHICPPMDTLTAFRRAAGALRFLQRHADPARPGLWAIERLEDGVVVGRVGLSSWADGARQRWELGYMLGSRFFGRGYATEAAGAVRDHAAATLGLTGLMALVHPENAASQGVLAKLGFSPEPERVVVEMDQPRQVWAWSPLPPSDA